MAVRVTTGGTLRMYRSNLTNSRRMLNNAMQQVMTQRNFSSYAEDPAAASQAFQMRREYNRTGDYIRNNEYLVSVYESAWTVIDNVSGDLARDVAKIAALRGQDASTGSGRQALGETLQSTADAVVLAMNTRYSEKYIFGGTDGLGDPPFGWDDQGNLTYRGVAVDNNANEAQLEAMQNEASYVDIGLGLSITDEGEVNPVSAYNPVQSLSGLSFLGYGTDEDGDPKNIASIINRLGQIYSRCDGNSGSYANTEDAQDADRLAGKLDDAMNRLTEQYARLDADAKYLNTNLKQLETSKFTLNEQIEALEQVDPAAAIMSMSWGQYCYNAALRIGNDVLSQSLLDYMR